MTMPDSITRFRYDGPSRRFRMPAFGIDVEQGETFDVDPDATLEVTAYGDEEPNTVALSVYLTDHLDAEFTRENDWYGVLNESVPDLRETLTTGRYDHRLDALAHAERESENRTTALEAIHERQEAIE